MTKHTPLIHNSNMKQTIDKSNLFETKTTKKGYTMNEKAH